MTARGCHAAYPQLGTDAIVAASALVMALQTIVARAVPAVQPVVLSVTQLHAGAAYNVLPDTATLAGTVRWFDRSAADLVARRMHEVCDGTARAHGVEVELKLRNVFEVLQNDPQAAAAMVAAAGEVVEPDKAALSSDLAMGSEDFADMLREVPGAYCTLGHAGTVPLHNSGYIFDDAILPVGAALLARMVETRGNPALPPLARPTP